MESHALCLVLGADHAGELSVVLKRGFVLPWSFFSFLAGGVGVSAVPDSVFRNF